MELVKYNKETNTVSIGEIEKQIALPYDRCFGRVLYKYDANESEFFNTGDKTKYGLKKLVVFEILSVGMDCKKVSVGDKVIINSGHPVQVNLTLNYLIKDLGNEFAVVPENLMLFKTDDEILVDNMVIAKFDRVYSENQSNYEKSTNDRLNNRMWVFEVLDDNGLDIEGKFVIDKFDTQNIYPIGDDRYLLTLNNFKIKL